MNIKSVFLSIIILATTSFASASDFPPRPNPPRLVNDFVGIFTQEQQSQLENELVDFDRNSSTQIAVVVVDDLLDYDVSDYAIQLGQKWGIGTKGKDNGVIILIKPTGSAGQKKAFIAIGYGLEGVIPDAIANRIVDNEMIPQFKNGNFFAGVEGAIATIKSLSLGEFSASDYEKKNYNNQKTRGRGLASLIIFGLLILFFIKPAIGAQKYSRTNNIGFWAAMILLMNSGRGNGNSWGNFTGGSGGFGGGGSFGGGGGFGGFGGGGFGGGGAGGSW